jgi:hypothetical protein
VASLATPRVEVVIRTTYNLPVLPFQILHRDPLLRRHIDTMQTGPGALYRHAEYRGAGNNLITITTFC